MAKKTAQLDKEPLVRTFPALPLRRSLALPFLRIPLLLTRPSTIQAAELAMRQPDRLLAVFTQLTEQEEPTGASDLSDVGVLVIIREFTPLPNGYIKLMVEGVDVLQSMQFTKQDDNFWVSTCLPLRRPLVADKLAPNLLEKLHKNLNALAELTDSIPQELRITLEQIMDLTEICYRVLPLLEPTPPVFIGILKCATEFELVNMTLDLIEQSIQAKESIVRADRRAARNMEKTHREWQVQQRIKSLQEELENPMESERDPELMRFEKRLRDPNIPQHIKEKVRAELARLNAMREAGPEGGVLRNYIDWLLSLPWGQHANELFDLKKIRKTLDAEHAGLEKVKERILEHAAVLSLVPDRRHSPILCLVGPPGVGKTSLVRSISDALERPLVRITLGGVRDESEIRGHRRTYVGSLPGRIIQALRKAKVMNPVVLLDEIDKMSSDFRGDPASALLEVLDPEQNHDFQDHYIELGVDLGHILFIATANTEESIPHALHDRFEMVRLSGYHRHEKQAIAKNHLFAKVSKRNGLEWEKQIQFSDAAIDGILEGYTREAGVRELERQIDQICRKRALEILSTKEKVLNKKFSIEVQASDLTRYLGVPRYSYHDLKIAPPGVITGLAYTQSGGEILPIECTLLSGRGRLQLTGKLGEVMKESAQIALTLVRQRALRFGVDPDIFRKTDIHVHVPEGAIPKDGPSAGIALTLALLSAFTRQSVPSTVAFTGEVSLTGQLHAIGGLPEKSVAALRHGVTELHLPNGNKRHIEELPAVVRKGLKINTHETIDSVIQALFVRPNSQSTTQAKTASKTAPNVAPTTATKSAPKIASKTKTKK